VSPQRFRIEPGQTQTIAVRIDFTAKPRTDESAAFALDYQAAERGGKASVGRWVITGKVKPVVVLEKPLDFGRRSVLS